MSTQALALIIVVASLIVLPVAGRAFWTSAVDRREWTSTSSLIFLSGMVGSLPTALSNLIARRQEVLDEFGNVRVGLSGWAGQLEQAIVAASLAAALLFFVRRALHKPVIGGPWIAIALLVITASADLVNGHVTELGPRLVVLLALLLATSVAQPGRPAFLGAAAVGLTYALLGAVQALSHPTDAFRACRPDKCGPGGALYVGAMSNENAFALVIALSIPFMWLALPVGRGRVAVVGYAAATVALTGSRTGQLAAAAALVALIVLRPSPSTVEGAAVAPIRQMTSILAVVGVATLGAALPLLASLETVNLGDRKNFWMLALNGIERSPLLGQGGTAWPRLYEIGETPAAGTYSPHNQWLDVTFASGLLGLAVFFGMLAHLLLRTSHLVRASAAILIPVLAASTFERPWSFASNDALTFTLLAALLCATNSPPSHSHAKFVSRAAAARRPDGVDEASWTTKCEDPPV